LPANAISSRGHSFIGVILDEFAFFESREDLQNTDTELVRAFTPALLTTRGPLIMISSPWCAEGEFYKACTSGWGDAGGDRSLLIHGQPHELNPTLEGDEEIAEAYRLDPISARSEYGAQWRDARSNFLDRAQILDLVEPIACRAPEPHAVYVAAVDMSSGLGADSATCAVSHYDPARNQTLLNGVIEVPPPFNAANAIEQIAKFLMPYQVHTVYGDRIGLYYTGDFGAKGLIYSAGDTEWSVPRKADNYLALLPLISSRSISLINNERMIDQLCSLSRRPMPGGYERIEASPGFHDDISDSVALSLTICHQRQACNNLLAPVMRADGSVMPYADALVMGYEELLLDYRQRQMERMYHG
jgi:hypothetical protein